VASSGSPWSSPSIAEMVALLAVSEAATGVISGLVDAERIAAVEAGTERIDRDLWKALADADLLGLAIPEADAGAGYGLMELCLLLEAQGNAVAPVPLWATLVLGALPLTRFGSEAQRGRWLPGVVAGKVILTSALTGSANSPTSMPAVRASAAVDGWVLQGTELAVPQAHLADKLPGKVAICLVFVTNHWRLANIGNL